MTVYAIGDATPQYNENTVFIAPSANVMGNVILEDNVNIWFGAVLRADDNTMTIGENTNIQDNAVLHLDPVYPCTVGKNVTIGHKAIVHGCTIGDNSLIGMGATILDGAKIGRNCLIGAGALVGMNKEIPDNSMVLGVPGKIIRQRGEEDEKMQLLHAAAYVEKGRMFRENLREI